MAMLGVAGTAAGVALAVVRERWDRMADARAASGAAEQDRDEESSTDSDDSK
ncbi:MAG: hypothetical protein VW271_04460 [Chloroflexota bacterium]